MNICAFPASYKVALKVFQTKKPYTISETLQISCIKDVCTEILGEVVSGWLLNDTIFQRIDNLQQDIKDKLMGENKLTKYFSLQLFICFTNKAILMVYVHFQHEGELKVEFFANFLPTKTTFPEVFKTVSNH